MARTKYFPMILLGLFASAFPAGASGVPTIEQIMARDFVGTPPENPYWSDDGRSIFYSQRRPRSEIVDLHRVDLASGRDEVVPAKERAAADYSGVWSQDRKIKAWLRDGDVYAKRVGGGTRQLTRTSEPESAVQVLLDGRVAFRRGDAFYAVDLDGGTHETLADVRFAKDPEEIKDPQGFLEEQQRRLIETLAGRAERKKERLDHERAQRAE